MERFWRNGNGDWEIVLFMKTSVIILIIPYNLYRDCIFILGTEKGKPENNSGFSLYLRNRLLFYSGEGKKEKKKKKASID